MPLTRTDLALFKMSAELVDKTMTSQLPTTSNPNLYEQDFYLWLMTTAQRLRDRTFTQLDLDNLIEEIESMGRSDKNALKSNLRILLMHLLKYKYQPSRRSNSWESTFIEHRFRLLDIFSESPSLKQYFTEVFDQCYAYALKLAAAETKLPLDTFPTQCPFTQKEILDINYLPE